jgi:Tfp pilus assembly protein PilZ
MAQNRRRHTRVRARGVAAHLRTKLGRSAAQVENVSMGGLFVRTDRLEEVGTELFVDLVKPGWKRQLTLNARITSRVDAVDGRISKRMPGMGIQFVRLDDKQHDRLASLLRELGAPEEDLQITLPEEHVEHELRALEFDTSGAPEPLDPQPQPLWQQVQMVETERAAPGGRRAGQVPSLVDDIEGALRDANLPAPGPVELEDRPFAATRAPDSSSALDFGRAPESIRAPAPDASAEARLMLQIRGLVMQLSEAQQQLSLRDLEIERLKDELDTVRSALERSVRKQ